MIRHCVFFKFRSDVHQAEREGVYAQLAALKQHLDGIVAFYSGPNVSPGTPAYDEGFIVDLKDVAARDTYLADEAHKAAGGRLVAAVEGGGKGLVVFDLAV